jgi:ketosteroid isomerase-like protein
MSPEDHEIITRMYRAWNSGDMDALADVFDAEVEVRPALSTFLASSVYRGHDGIAAWYAETYEPWAEMTCGSAVPRR